MSVITPASTFGFSSAEIYKIDNKSIKSNPYVYKNATSGLQQVCIFGDGIKEISISVGGDGKSYKTGALSGCILLRPNDTMLIVFDTSIKPDIIIHQIG